MITEKDMVESCVQALREIPAVERAVADRAGTPEGIPGQARYRADAELELITREGRLLRLLIEAKPAAALRHSMAHVHYLLAEAAQQRNAHPVFFTDYAGPALAKQMAAQGMDFVDMAGNMRLDVAGLYLEVSGRRSPGARPARGALWTPAALRLAHLLLMRPDLASQPQRRLAEFAGIAHGGVHALLAGLEQAGYMVRIRSRVRRLLNPQSLALKWVDGYGQRLRRTLLLGAYRRDGDLAGLAPAIRDLNAQDSGGVAVLGGELVAQRLVGELLRPASVTVYLPEGVEKRKVMAHVRLMPDSGGNVALVRSFFPSELHLPAALLAGSDLEGNPCASALAIQGELALIPDSRVAPLRESFARKILEPMLNASGPY